MGFTFTAEDQKPLKEPPKPIKPGTYKAFVASARNDVTKKGDQCMVICIRTQADKAAAPEGNNTYDFYVTQKSWNLTNFLQVFAASMVGQEGEIDDEALDSLKGTPCKVVIGMSKPTYYPGTQNVQYESRPEIKKILPADKGAQPVEVDGELPF